ncbi:MAG: peptide ABC transporter substrate-binding protein [Dehalococcoidia bacterium]|jgi:oligopeptide transport system substrate-binding protein
MFRKQLFNFLGIITIVVCLLAAAPGCSLLTKATENIPLEQLSGPTLNLWDQGPLTLDPAISSEMASQIYILHIFSGLVRFDSDLKPVPDIADHWNISDDGKTYTFYLRNDVKFHDGRPLTAQDFKFSLERACNPATGSQTASTYLNDIVGAPEMISGKADNLSGVTIVDDYTLKITIDAPKAYFLSKLAYPTAFAVDKKNVESGPNWWKKPVGTGPYKLTKWDEGSLILLQPNEYYYGEKGKVNVAFNLLSGMPMSLYETGKIDVVDVYKNNIDRAMDKEGPFYDQLHIYPEFSLQYIGFNTSKPPFDDVYVRQAFCYAVNKDRIVSVLQKNMVAAAGGIIPPGMPGYNKDVKGLNYDPDKARELLAKSKYGSADKLPPITMTMPGTGANVDDFIGAILLDWKQNLGVTVNVRLLDPLVFNYHLFDEGDEIYTLGWIADYPDPEDFLNTLFYTGSQWNNSHYSNKDLDALLDRAAVDMDQNERTTLYQQAEQLVVDQAPVLPLWFSKNYILVNPRVHGFDIDPLGVPHLNLVTLGQP